MTDVLDAAADFVWRTGRLIDRHRFAHQFLGGDRAPVLDALAAYQNPDGGFGNALEPDLRGPASQPETLEVAFWVLDGVDTMDDPMVTAAVAGLLHKHRVDHPWLAPATAWTWGAVDAIDGPLEFAPGPDSMARRLFADEVIEAHLDHLLASQRPDGGWTVNFPAWTEAAGLEWRAWVTVHNLGVLRSYGRLG